MVDIHCHILPDVDDGAKNIDDSLLMAKEAVNQGIRTIIATPHHNNGQYLNEKVTILAKVTELNEHLAKEKIPLTILPGQEVRIYGEILADYQAGKILPLAETAYLFIELPSGHVPRYTERVLYDLQVEGLIPIIVHPERNQEIIRDPDLLYRFVKNGALTQITAASLCGQFGNNIKKFSLQLIEANLTHFIASDAHNVHNRSFKMMEAMAEVKKKYGVDSAYYFSENPELIVQGMNVLKEVPERVQRKKFLGIF